MIRTFLAEWRKLRRPTLFLGSLVAALSLSSLVTSILFLMVDSRTGNSRRGEMVSRATLELPSGVVIGFSGAAGFLGLIALCVFAAQTAQEYTYGTLRNILVRQPRRFRLLVGKYLAMLTFAKLIIVLACAFNIALAYTLAHKMNISTAAWGTHSGLVDLFHTYVNVLIAAFAYGTIGMILGLLLRSPISAISIGIGWLLIVDNILAATINNSAKWLPGQLIDTIARGKSPEMSYLHATTTISIYLVIASAIAVVLFRRRDVSN